MTDPMPYAIGSLKLPGLSKLTEECGETLQIVGKLMGTGGKPDHWDGSDLYGRLVEELADLQAAIDFVALTNFTGDVAIAFERRAEHKLQTFKRWHDEQLARS